MKNKNEQLHHIPVTQIVPSRWQPRDRFDAETLLELAKHIKAHGLMYPVILFINEDGEFELVAGERRTRAIAALGLTQAQPWIAKHGNGLRKAVTHVAEHGWTGLADGAEIEQAMTGTTITARIEPPDDHRRLHELAVADNIQRENLSPIEEARALHDLMQEHGLSQRDVARQIGWSQSKVQERLSLLKLAPEARAALTARAFSASHARHIARCPAEVQPAVTEYVTALIDTEGDQAATVRQVAVLTQHVRKFLNPQRWLPPDGEIITPTYRNILRLMHYLVETIDLLERGEAITALHQVGSYNPVNLLSKNPKTLNSSQLRKIIIALTGQQQSLDKAWTKIAPLMDWCCDHCRFRELAPPERSAFRLPCQRWHASTMIPDTCLGFIGPGDPMIVGVEDSYDDRGLLDWTRQFAPDDLIITPFPHFIDYAAWKCAVEQATLAKEKRQRQAEEERQTKHVVELREYWHQQDGFFVYIEHFQAHRCEKCTHYQPELLDRDLPPCEFAVNPLPGRWSDAPMEAPDFGILVREDGLMVPRCTYFRTFIQEIAGLAGFHLPDRKIVLEWLRAGIARAPGSYTRDYTLAAPLAWLPYSRPNREDLHDMDKLLRYLKRAWDDLGDEAMATLITVALMEAKAMTSYRGILELMDPTTLETERWASVRWNAVIEGGNTHNYPNDWPKPWVKE